MKKLLVALAVLISSEAFSEVTPQLFIQPAPIFDMLCQQTPFKIEPLLQDKLRVELSKKLKVFQNEWDKAALSVIASSEEAAGRTFTRKEYSVALSLCGWIPMGDPVLLVSALPYLGEARKSRGFSLPMNINAFVSMTHHELLHSLVDNIINNEFSATSNLLEKYKHESYNVLVHLHLLAIQKAVYQRPNNELLLAATDQLYAYIGGDYQRGWEIVSHEGTEGFLHELQVYNSKTHEPERHRFDR